MTASGDFLPGEDNQGLEQVGPTYPTAFGIELTPKVQAIALGLLGLLGAFALYNFVVQPVQEQKTALEAEVAQKEAQVAQQRASLQNRAELQAQLDAALEQRVGVYSLLGNAQTLDTLLLDINQQIQNSNAAIADVLRADPARLDNAQLAALGLNRAQIQRVKTLFAGNTQLQTRLYTSELLRFNPSPSVLLADGPPELNGKLERFTVDVSMQALFPQTLSIMRNIERLEPLIIIRDVQQSIAPPPEGATEEQLLGISRLLLTDFTLEVLVPVGDPSIPPPPPAPEAPAEGEVPVEGEVPPEGG
jgi:type IV pilus assembly protein PilO